MIRFIHSADWQLGARFSQFGTKAGQLRAARLTTLQKTLALAVSKQCDAFLIAGDLFEDIFAQGQAMRRVAMHMADWIRKLDGFLTLNERDILTHAGRISHEMAQAKAELEYDKFKALTAHQTQPVDQAFEEAAEKLKRLPKPRKPKPPKS